MGYPSYKNTNMIPTIKPPKNTPPKKPSHAAGMKKMLKAMVIIAIIPAMPARSKILCRCDRIFSLTTRLRTTSLYNKINPIMILAVTTWTPKPLLELIDSKMRLMITDNEPPTIKIKSIHHRFDCPSKVPRIGAN